jgi:hypothetical protein
MCHVHMQMCMQRMRARQLSVNSTTHPEQGPLCLLGSRAFHKGWCVHQSLNTGLILFWRGVKTTRLDYGDVGLGHDPRIPRA